MKIKVCSKCHCSYDDSLYTCPKCQTQNPKYTVIYIINALIFAACIFGGFLLYHNFIMTQESSKNATVVSEQTMPVQNQGPQQEETKTEQTENTIGSDREQKINIRPMTELSNKSINEILEMRKKYVMESPVFGNNPSYEPRNEVFQIEDNLPWISAPQITKYGVNNNPHIGEGISRHSLSINNPELLLAFIINSYSKRSVEYASEADYMLPDNLVWIKPNTIHANFKISDFFNKNPQYTRAAMHLEDTNARDMGYNWIYCDTAEDISFMDPENNISKDLYELRGYYHKGFACGLESGCNNYSPNQPPLRFYIGRHGLLNCKLWKDKPISKDNNPDFVYLMTW